MTHTGIGREDLLAEIASLQGENEHLRAQLAAFDAFHIDRDPPCPWAASPEEYRKGWEDGLDRATCELRVRRMFDAENVIEAVPRVPGPWSGKAPAPRAREVCPNGKDWTAHAIGECACPDRRTSAEDQRSHAATGAGGGDEDVKQCRAVSPSAPGGARTCILTYHATGDHTDGVWTWNSDAAKRCRKCQVPLRRVGDDNLTGMHCESCLRSESVRNRLDALAEKVATFVPREGLIIRGWFCETCRVFNGEEKEPLTACRSCARPRTCRGCEGLHGHAGPCVWPRNEIERVEREAFSLMSDANELDTCACGESTCIHCQKVPQ